MSDERAWHRVPAETGSGGRRNRSSPFRALASLRWALPASAALLGCRSTPGALVPVRHEGRTAGGLWYAVEGIGPTVVLIHGSNLDSRTFEPLVRDLARDHRVVVTDLRFHGHSVDDGARYSFAGDVRAVLDAAGVERAIVVGHSLGAAIGIDLALDDPLRVGALVLVGPSVNGFVPKRSIPGLAGMAAAARAGDWGLVAQEYAASPVMRLYRDTTGAALLRTVIAENLALFRSDPTRLIMAHPPAAERLPALHVPVLVVTGEEDPTPAPEVADFVMARVAGAREVRIPGCGHIVPLDCPGPLLKLIREERRRLDQSARTP